MRALLLLKRTCDGGNWLTASICLKTLAFVTDSHRKVGFIVLTPEMNETLRYPTESVSKDNQTPLVGLEVFHQLHCLNSIRKVVYGTDQYFNPFDRQDQIHLGSCCQPYNGRDNADLIQIIALITSVKYVESSCSHLFSKSSIF